MLAVNLQPGRIRAHQPVMSKYSDDDGNLAGRPHNDGDDGRADEPISKVASGSSMEGQSDEWAAKGNTAR